MCCHIRLAATVLAHTRLALGGVGITDGAMHGDGEMGHRRYVPASHAQLCCQRFVLVLRVTLGTGSFAPTFPSNEQLLVCGSGDWTNVELCTISSWSVVLQLVGAVCSKAATRLLYRACQHRTQRRAAGLPAAETLQQGLFRGIPLMGKHRIAVTAGGAGCWRSCTSRRGSTMVAVRRHVSLLGV